MRGKTNIQLRKQSLGATEQAHGFILTRCRAAISDVELGATDLGRLAHLKVQALPARIDSLIELADDVLEVVLRARPASQSDFLSDQQSRS